MAATNGGHVRHDRTRAFACPLRAPGSLDYVLRGAATRSALFTHLAPASSFDSQPTWRPGNRTP